MVKKRYDLVDYYENPRGERIFSSDSKDEIKEQMKQWCEDTDNECALVVYDNKERKQLYP